LEVFHATALRSLRKNDKQIIVLMKSDLYDMIFQVVRMIPRGRVTNYGAIAKYIGSGARVVGYAMNACHTQKKKVPAHRVVNSAGLLTGKHHFSTPYEMQEKLEKEGVKVKNDKVVDFEKKFWDPAKEIKI
jgi:methylated-DNA-protein-cysteine methyltransferase-like protein